MAATYSVDGNLEMGSRASTFAAVPGQEGKNRKQGNGSKRKTGQGKGHADRKPAALQRNRMINRSISAAAESGDTAALFSVISSSIDDMNGLNLATSLHRVAKIAPKSDSELASFKRMPVFLRLFNSILEQIQGHTLRSTAKGSNSVANRETGEMPVQCLSIVAWSFASLQIRHQVCFQLIADIASPRLSELKPYELSNLLWAFAKAGLSHCDLFKRVADRLLTRTPGEFKVQCLSTVAWSFATLKRRNLTLFNSLAKELSMHVKTMKPQEMSNTLWAYAKNGYAQTELFQAIGDNIVRQATPTDFKPQEISNSAWAFATVGMHHPTLFAKIEEISLKQRQAVAPQNVANLVWAFAKLGLKPGKQFLGVLVDSTIRRMPQYKPPELSAVVWAMSQVIPQGNAEFFDILAAACIDRIHEFSSNGVANLLNAFASVDVAKPYHYLTMLRYGVSRLQHFLPRAVVTLAQGVTTAAASRSYEAVRGCLQKDMVEISQCIKGRLADFNSTDLRDLADVANSQFIDLSDFRAALRSEELFVSSVTKRTESLGSMSTSADEDTAFASDDDENTNPLSDSANGDNISKTSRKPSLASSCSSVGSNDRSIVSKSVTKHLQGLFAKSTSHVSKFEPRGGNCGAMAPAAVSAPIFIPVSGAPSPSSGALAGSSFLWQAEGQCGPMKVIVPSLLK